MITLVAEATSEDVLARLAAAAAAEGCAVVAIRDGCVIPIPRPDVDELR